MRDLDPDANAYVDPDEMADGSLRELTNRIIGCAIEVHRHLHGGHLEVAYERAMAIELQRRGIPFRQQHPVNVVYKGEVVSESRLDFLIDDRVILEIKAVESLSTVHTAQVLGYLAASGLHLALIINFNVRRLVDGIKRVVK
ncbi:MAG TPA: GxxExxY protein [Tepidisphaeraceae bacterium]|nr:GxxExxY protein [Tepidisphaeraceae bacterium]